MKATFTFLVGIFMACMAVNAQVGINANGALPNASAMLDVSSNNKGVLVPRMTKDQKKLIPSPAVGLLVYQNGPDSVGFHYYSGTTWVWLGNSSVGWSITGNAGTDSTVHFLGTTDNKPLMLRLNNKVAGQLNARTHNNYIGYFSGNSNTTGTYNTAMGDSAQTSTVSVINSTAVGAVAMANKKEGASAKAVGTYSLQFDSSALGNTGLGTSSLRYNKRSNENTAIGFLAGRNITGDTTAGFNTYIGAEAGFGINPATLRYQVDNPNSNHVFFAGAGSTASTELMRIQGNGTVTINKPTPTTGSGAGTLQIQSANPTNDILGLYSATTGNHWSYYISGSSNDLSLYYNGTQRGVFSSTNGVYTSFSDRRLKKDIQPIGNVLAAINKIPSYRFHYNDNKATDELTVGFMAQDLQADFPDAVSTIVNKDGTTNLGVKYQYISVYAVKSIQEQQQVIETQQKQIEKLEERLSRLEKLLQK